MRGISAEAARLVRLYIEAGWTARRSNRNHIILRAPDGTTTHSIARNLSRANRSQQNAEAPLKRWLRQQREAS